MNGRGFTNPVNEEFPCGRFPGLVPLRACRHSHRRISDGPGPRR
jgi:hypothetical protein